MMDFSKTLRTVWKKQITHTRFESSRVEWVLFSDLVDLAQVLVALWQLISPKKHCATKAGKTNLTRTSIENEFSSAARLLIHPTSTPPAALVLALLGFSGPASLIVEHYESAAPLKTLIKLPPWHMCVLCASSQSATPQHFYPNSLRTTITTRTNRTRWEIHVTICQNLLEVIILQIVMIK